jgi:hypothetical protein
MGSRQGGTQPTKAQNDFGSSVHVSRTSENASNMKKANKSVSDDEMLPEYDFSKGVRGKYAKRYAEGTNVVLLAPDVAKVFKNSEAVNAALRGLIEIAGRTAKGN